MQIIYFLNISIVSIYLKAKVVYFFKNAKYFTVFFRLSLHFLDAYNSYIVRAHARVHESCNAICQHAVTLASNILMLTLLTRAGNRDGSVLANVCRHAFWALFLTKITPNLLLYR